MRLLHTMLRVGDMDRAIEFYTGVMGMQLLRRNDYPEGRFTLAFVGYGPESDNSVIELTHNWGVSRYDIGDGYGHIAVSVDDLDGARARMDGAGLSPGPLRELARDGKPVARFFFIKDPDGYSIEVLQRGGRFE